MALTSGFFNSKNGDRKYDSEQVASLFQGLITDGVYITVGNKLRTVTTNGSNEVAVDTGRAWFNNTWTHNSELYPLKLPVPDMVLNRWDAVYIEINKSDAVRKNSFVVRSGVSSKTPEKPKAVIKTDNSTLYCLSYVYRKPTVDKIAVGDIVYVPGSVTGVGFVTGVVSQLTPEDYIQKFLEDTRSWWLEYSEDSKSKVRDMILEMKSSYQETSNQIYKEFGEAKEDLNKQIVDVQLAMTTWTAARQEEFDTWFDQLQSTMDENIAAQLTGDVTKLKQDVATLKTEVIRIDKKIDESDSEVRKWVEKELISNSNLISEIAMRRDMSWKHTATTNLNTLRLTEHQGSYLIKASEVGYKANRPKLLDTTRPIAIFVDVFDIGDQKEYATQTIVPFDEQGIYSFRRSYNPLNSKWGEWVRNDGVIDKYTKAVTQGYIDVVKYADGQMTMSGILKINTLVNHLWGTFYTDKTEYSVVYPEKFAEVPHKIYRELTMLGANAVFQGQWDLFTKTVSGWSGGINPMRPNKSDVNVPAQIAWSVDGYWKVPAKG